MEVWAKVFGELAEEVVIGVVVGLLGVALWLGRRIGVADVERADGRARNAEEKAAIADDARRLAEEQRAAMAGDLEAARGALATEKQRAESLTGDLTAARASLERSETGFAGYRAKIDEAVRGDVWGRTLRPDAQRVEHFDRRSRIPIIAVGNFKGGVGKTTVAGNLGAYLADPNPGAGRAPKRVLYVDFDWQGSLSSALLELTREQEANRALNIFKPDVYSPQTLVETAARINRDSFQPGSAFFDCGYQAAETEDRLVFDWAVAEGEVRDVRLGLADFLHSNPVQNGFDAVVIDLPPRNSTFTYNALAAATHVLVVSRVERLSAQGVPRFVEFLTEMRERLQPSMKIVGVAPNMLRQSDTTKTYLEPAVDAARRLLPRDETLDLLPPIKLLNAFAGGERPGFAYNNDRLARTMFTAVGDAVLRRLTF